MQRLIVHRPLLRKLRRDNGQAAFEFLLVFPALVVFLLMAVDFGAMMYEFVSVSNAVREGARYASVNCGDLNCGDGTGDTPVARAVARSSGFLSSSEVKVVWPDGVDRGDPATVCARHAYDFLFFPGFSIDVHSASEMRLEQKDNWSGATIGSVTC